MLFLCILALAVPTSQAQENGIGTPRSNITPRVLVPGSVVSATLGGRTSHFYQIAAEAGRFLQVTIQQAGVDIAVTIRGPDGRKLMEGDSPNGAWGPEQVSLLTQAAGIYRCEIRSGDETLRPGKYEMSAILRDVVSDDSRRLAAQEAFSNGLKLSKQPAKESLHKAIEQYGQAVSLWRALGNQGREALAARVLGKLLDLLGEKQTALGYYERSLALFRLEGDQSGQAVTLSSRGSLIDSLGNKDQARADYEEAVKLFRAVGNRIALGSALSNLGMLHNFMGERQQALSLLNQGLELLQEPGNAREKAKTLNAIGFVYHSLGDSREAQSHYAKALQLFRATNDRLGEANVLNSLGLDYAAQGESLAALAQYDPALKIFRAIGDRGGQATVLDNMGGAHRLLDQIQQALSEYQQALTIERELMDRGGEARSLSKIGLLYLNLGEPQQAADYCEKALPLLRAVQDHEGEAHALSRLARASRDRADLRAALTQSTGALGLIESLRVQVASPDLRASYFATAQDLYTFHSDLLMRLHAQEPTRGYAAAALATSERARARSLLEALPELREGGRQGTDSVLLGRRQQNVEAQISAKILEQRRLLNGKPAQIEAAQRELDRLLAEHERFNGELRVASPRYSALTKPASLDLTAIQRDLLDSETVLLEYSLGEERSWVWLVSHDSLYAAPLPKRADIEVAVSRVLTLARSRSIIEDPNAWPKAAAKLSRMILAPISANLGAQRLLIVADGMLQYVPFAALPIPTAQGVENEPLIIRHEIVHLPSASVLAVLRRELADRSHAPKTLAVFADPVFDSGDARVTRVQLPLTSVNSSARSHESSLDAQMAELQRSAISIGIPTLLGRLAYSRQEADALLALVPSTDRLAALDFGASREAALNGSLSQYRFVHFATHGMVNSERPALSGLVLSLVDERGRDRDGFLRLLDVYNLRLNADLVTLSACQTGLGKNVRGEGLMGLVRGFFYAGAARVVASLWQVDDHATAELMRRFYAGMLGPRHLRPVAALREAQLAMRWEKRWQAPYYWAGFTLQGEWQ